MIASSHENLLRLLNLPTDNLPPGPTPAGGRAPEDNLLDAYSQAVMHVVDRVSPAVIAISGPRNGDPRGGSGSGFLLTPDGYALTNSHVVHGRRRLTATTHDGDVLDADVIGDDPSTDLALIRLSARDLPIVALGDSQALRVGQLVVAIGSPFGLQATVSSGIVSAQGRNMRGVGGRLIDDVVQHTAPINPGNSGGPLVDSRGRVIGVNTAVIAFAQGVGFAIPSNTARWVLGELISHGRVRRVVLGIAAGTAPIPRRLVRELDLLNDSGVLVESVESGCAAARAGVEPDDVIIALDGRIISGIDDLHRLLSRIEPNRAVSLTILRHEYKKELTVLPVLPR